MQQQIRYGCTSLVGSNKTGLLAANADGYYPMVLGAMNMFNSAGDYYPYEEAKSLFETSGAFMRRVQRGVLKGEYGHPIRQPNMDKDMFAHRVLTVQEINVSHHISEVWLEFNHKGPDGRPIVAVMGLVKPCGPQGPFLLESINNKKENVCFSIRSFTKDVQMPGGFKNKILKTIVTFDYVNEPGMSNAEKFKNPALESFDWTTFGRGELERAMKPQYVEEGELVSMEAAQATAEELFTAMEWTVPKEITFGMRKPIYRGWKD